MASRDPAYGLNAVEFFLHSGGGGGGGGGAAVLLKCGCFLLKVTDSLSERVVAAPVGRIAESAEGRRRVGRRSGGTAATVDVAPW